MFKRITSAAFLAILMLCAVFVNAQQIDTVKVVLLVTDTTGGQSVLKSIYAYQIRNIEYREVDVSINPNYQLPGGGMTLMGWIPRYEKKAFYSHADYLDDKRKQLRGCIVWQCVSAK